MNRINPKIRAFTIFEMMVTILLSLILFSLLYTSYEILSEQLDRGSHDLSEILRVKICLDHSIEQANQIISEPGKINFAGFEKKRYILLMDTCIVCQADNVTDTIFKGKYSYRIHENPDLKLIDAFYFEFYNTATPVILNARKNYLPSVWLRRKEVNFEY